MSSMTNPDQNQAWLEELLDTFDPFDNSHNDFLRRKPIAKAKILANQQAAIDRAVAEARIAFLKEQTEDIDEAILLWRKNERKHHSWLLSWLEDNRRALAALTTPKERKQ